MLWTLAVVLLVLWLLAVGLLRFWLRGCGLCERGARQQRGDG